MYFEQFYLSCLAHASYMVGSDGVGAVVDPRRDVEMYLNEAKKSGLRIEYVIETHLHADFVSGHRELASRTGAKIYLGAIAGATFPHVPIREGDELRFGKCSLRFLETPGHTIESICNRGRCFRGGTCRCENLYASVPWSFRLSVLRRRSI